MAKKIYKPLDSDTEPDHVEWWQLEETFGSVPDAPADTTLGAVAKTLTNKYWRLLKGWNGSYGEAWRTAQEKGTFPVEYLVALNGNVDTVINE